MKYDQLPERAKAALWQYMIPDGGVEENEYESHVRRFTYTLRTYSPRSVLKVWEKITPIGCLVVSPNGGGEERIRQIERLRAKGQLVWPYIVGHGHTFREWASDEMNHGDGFHRTMASIRADRPVEFLFLKLKLKVIDMDI